MDREYQVHTAVYCQVSKFQITTQDGCYIPMYHSNILGVLLIDVTGILAVFKIIFLFHAPVWCMGQWLEM